MAQRKSRAALLCLIPLLWIAGVAEAAKRTLENKVDRIIRKAGITDSTPGVAVLVIENGEVVLKKGQ